MSHTVNLLLMAFVSTARYLIARNVTMGNNTASYAKITLNRSIPPVLIPVGIIMGARGALTALVLNA